MSDRMPDPEVRKILGEAVQLTFDLWDTLRTLEGPDGLVDGEITTDDWFESLGQCGIIDTPDDDALEYLRKHLEFHLGDSEEEPQ